jgi:hypothetical protein
MNRDEVEVQYVWVFNGLKNKFPSAVFTDRHLAEAWIAKNQATGVLTAYPLDIGAYEWAVTCGYFRPKHEAHTAPEFICNFSSAVQEHEHYYKGLTGVAASNLAEADGAEW